MSLKKDIYEKSYEKKVMKKVMNKNNALIIFSKPPIAGLAKTRLIPALGEEGAAEYHGKLLRHTLTNVVCEGEWDSHLWCSENMGHSFFQSCLADYAITLHEQSGDDLGERMANAIQSMLGEYESVCIIGSDCPVLNRDKIRIVFASLNSKDDVVITPAEDGGYVLLAVRQQLRTEIFSGIKWGGADVYRQTLNKVRLLALKPAIQPVLWDVDEPADLDRIIL